MSLHAHAVQRHVLGASGHLLDGGQIRGRVEEPRQPQSVRSGQSVGPLPELRVASHQIGEPAGQALLGGPGALLPARLVEGVPAGHLEDAQRLGQVLHRHGHVELAVHSLLQLHQALLDDVQEGVHPRRFLRGDDDERAVGLRQQRLRAFSDGGQVELVRALVYQVLHSRPELHRRGGSAARASGADLQDGSEQRVRHHVQVANLSVRVQPEERRGLGGERPLDVAGVARESHSDGIRGVELWRQLGGVQQPLVERDGEIRLASPPVPEVRDVTSVHDLTEEVPQILERHAVLGVGDVQIVGQDVGADAQVSNVERVTTGPALRAEPLPSEHETVEEAKAKEAASELLRLAAPIQALLVEGRPRPQQVALEVGGRLVRDLDAGLKEGLGDVLHGREGGRLGADEAAEAGVRGLGAQLQLPVEGGQPGLHQVQVLEHDPTSLGGHLLKHVLRRLLLALAQTNVDKGALLGADVERSSELLDQRGGVHPGEKHEEDGRARRGFLVS
mmetsp:Transcript_25703/g.48343  ORF Transcript_25703/g.48343 Transcript_25703/m.48343 type:complete len:504 (-) Transcript_25703:3030-4541(-)